MEPLAPVSEVPPPLAQNHFQSDRVSGLSEDALGAILAAPVFLPKDSRVAVVRVQDRYALDAELPLEGITAELQRTLERSGHFEAATEASADWPADSGISGLRELAARYRADYLMLYRHRFVERTSVNHFAWLYPTLIGIFATPSITVETAGVLEATLLDAKTGTLLFTAFERVSGDGWADVASTDDKLRVLQAGLLEKAAAKLVSQVAALTQRLVDAELAYRERALGQAAANGP
jgi:hypothetical protein